MDATWVCSRCSWCLQHVCKKVPSLKEKTPNTLVPLQIYSINLWGWLYREIWLLCQTNNIWEKKFTLWGSAAVWDKYAPHMRAAHCPCLLRQSGLFLIIYLVIIKSNWLKHFLFQTKSRPGSSYILSQAKQSLDGTIGNRWMTKTTYCRKFLIISVAKL